MGLGLAWKAFIKAFKEPEKAQEFVNDQPAVKHLESVDQGHLRLLGYLQQGGRLIDFIKEDLSHFSDAQVGAAVRRIHQECAQTLEELVTIRPLRDEMEGALVQVPRDYDPAEIKVVGQVKGEPPFTGILVHKGWKAHKRSLPKKTADLTNDVICPAEIEVKA
jgi:Domain of unknown function (DUF2760)